VASGGISTVAMDHNAAARPVIAARPGAPGMRRIPAAATTAIEATPMATQYGLVASRGPTPRLSKRVATSTVITR